MKKKDFKKLLRGYNEGKLNEKEKYLLDNWYNSFGYSENIKPFQDITNTQRIEKKLLSALNQHVSNQVKVHKINLWPYGIAASFFLAALSAFFYFNTAKVQTLSLVYDTIKTLPGEMKKVKLPDSSEVWMNAGSTIRYASATFEKKRTIFLDEGEAFFKVTKDPKHPFEVHTPKLFTRVLGTSFNIKAYNDLKYTSIMVKTGRVQVNVNESSGKTTAPVITVNQGFVYDHISKSLKRSDVDAEDSNSWITGDMTLREATFKELALIIHNRYGLTLTSSNPEVIHHHYTVILQDKSIERAMKLICSIHNNHYRRNQNEIIIY